MHKPPAPTLPAPKPKFVHPDAVLEGQHLKRQSDPAKRLITSPSLQPRERWYVGFMKKLELPFPVQIARDDHALIVARKGGGWVELSREFLAKHPSVIREFIMLVLGDDQCFQSVA
jgi:hypothetical protein